MKANASYILGIDVGGTHIDLVAVNQDATIIAVHKEILIPPLEDCILKAIQRLIHRAPISIENCIGIHLGTTLAVNSLIELKSLYRVGVIRIAGHHPELPSAFSWPSDKRETILAGVQTIHGGREYDNKPINSFQVQELKPCLAALIAQGVEAIAIVGVFSPLYPEEEDQIATMIRDSTHQHIPLTLSHQVGGLGFVERENNAIINAALKKVIRKHFQNLKHALINMGFSCPIFVTQNNGTLLSFEQTMEFPIRTIASGPTNSLTGACKLAKQNAAIVIDIGGTSTEIGIVEAGFPRYSSSGAEIAGIPTHFMLPQLKILALGGGSIIRQTADEIKIGPESLGGELFAPDRCIDNSALTLFDIGKILKSKPQNRAIQQEALNIMETFLNVLTKGIEYFRIDHHLPILWVGGGAENIPDAYFNAKNLRPSHYQVANAYGAAMAEVSGSIDVTRHLSKNRQEIIQELENQAMAEAIRQGAKAGTTRIIEKRLLPFFYMPHELTRIIITAAGEKSLPQLRKYATTNQ